LAIDVQENDSSRWLLFVDLKLGIARWMEGKLHTQNEEAWAMEQAPRQR